MPDDVTQWVLDVNVLIYAYLGQTRPQQRCKTWLEKSLQASKMSLWLPTVTKLGFVRLLGSGVITQQPVPFALLHDYLELLEQLGARETIVGTNHPTFWRVTTSLIQPKGNDVTDSHMAATAMELNATLVTCDKGFGRFTGLKVFDPTLDG
jgi:uncharacterized protein